MSIFFPLSTPSGEGGTFYFVALLSATVQSESESRALLSATVGDPTESAALLSADVQGGSDAAVVVDLVNEALR